MDQKQRPRRTVRREVKRRKCLENHGVLTICPLEVTGDLDGPPAGAEFKEATRELGSQWPGRMPDTLKLSQDLRL